MQQKVYLSWKKYIESLNKIINHFQNSNEKFDIIVGLTRGGLIPAVYLSHALDTPMIAFNPHSLHADGTPRENIVLPISPSVIRKILIVDETSDTGKAFIKCINFFTKKGFICKTTSVYINKKITKFTPDFALYDSKNKWIVFPYEFYENIYDKNK